MLTVVVGAAGVPRLTLKRLLLLLSERMEKQKLLLLLLLNHQLFLQRLLRLTVAHVGLQRRLRCLALFCSAGELQLLQLKHLLLLLLE